MRSLRHLALVAFVSLVAYAGGLVAWFVGSKPHDEDIYFYGALQKAHEGARFKGFLYTLAGLAVGWLLYRAYCRSGRAGDQRPN